MARPWGNMNESSLSETERSRALIVSMKHYLVDHNQVCSNYGRCSSNSDTRLMRPRTDEWRAFREKANLTGGTFLKAIGLDGLRIQAESLCYVLE